MVDVKIQGNISFLMNNYMVEKLFHSKMMYVLSTVTCFLIMVIS